MKNCHQLSLYTGSKISKLFFLFKIYPWHINESPTVLSHFNLFSHLWSDSYIGCLLLSYQGFGRCSGKQHRSVFIHLPKTATLWWNTPMFQQVYLPLFIYLHTLLVLFVFTRRKKRKKKAPSNGTDTSCHLFLSSCQPSFQAYFPKQNALCRKKQIRCGGKTEMEG